MILNFDDQGVYTVNLPNVSPAEYAAIRDYFAPLILNPAMKARERERCGIQLRTYAVPRGEPL